MKLDKNLHSLQSAWRSAWKDVTASNNRDIHFDEIVGDVDLNCHIDEFRIGQVFRNLFENSVAACGENPSIHVHCENGDGTLKVIVRDNGPGLDAEQRENVFQPFFTTKSKGTGLGMAIVKRIIDAHGGEIRVGDSEQGAEFRMVLPLGSP
jgi:signal transduction histidine kinase